jgi:putative serine protease PepD
VVPAGRPRSRRRRVPLGLLSGLVVAAFGAGLLGGLVGARIGDDDRLVDAGLPAAVGSGAGDRAPESVAGIADTVLPSVVSIEVSAPEGTSSGSGFVLRQDGYILTNHHVVAGAVGAGTSVVVLLGDGSQLPASVVGSTADYDLAVLKVEAEGMTPLVLGDSDDVRVGDPVVAVGAPLGLAGTVTSGIVSARNRPVAAGGGTESTAFINAIQTDAAINPGNSGGPLVNAAGEVVGINSAIAQPPGASASSGGSIGLGFAIPSNQARRTAEQLIETGSATYPVIGVLLDASYTGEGVQVATAPQGSQQPVTAGGPADRAGIRPGDVILSIDGRPVTASDELIVAIRARTPGDTVELRVRGVDGAERDVPVVLDESAQG